MITKEQARDIWRGTKLRLQHDDGIEHSEIEVAHVLRRSHRGNSGWDMDIEDTTGQEWSIDHDHAEGHEVIEPIIPEGVGSQRVRALSAFQAILDGTPKPGELVALKAAGWIEDCPSETFWTFWHRGFPGVTVRWYPGDGVVAY